MFCDDPQEHGWSPTTPNKLTLSRRPEYWTTGPFGGTEVYIVLLKCQGDSASVAAALSSVLDRFHYRARAGPAFAVARKLAKSSACRNKWCQEGNHASGYSFSFLQIPRALHR